MPFHKRTERILVALLRRPNQIGITFHVFESVTWPESV